MDFARNPDGQEILAKSTPKSDSYRTLDPKQITGSLVVLNLDFSCDQACWHAGCEQVDIDRVNNRRKPVVF